MSNRKKLEKTQKSIYFCISFLMNDEIIFNNYKVDKRELLTGVVVEILKDIKQLLHHLYIII